jgi:hypothetical protein
MGTIYLDMLEKLLLQLAEETDRLWEQDCEMADISNSGRYSSLAD